MNKWPILNLKHLEVLHPRTSPRLLRDELATVATDVNLESGRLVPVTDNSDTLTLSSIPNKVSLNIQIAQNVGYSSMKM